MGSENSSEYGIDPREAQSAKMIDLRGVSDESQSMDAMMHDKEDRNDFWSVEGNYICRHHNES